MRVIVAYQFRLDTGYPGTSNRVHDATVTPEVIDAAAPPLAYGLGCVIDATTGGIRAAATGDTKIDGFNLRPYPMQGGGPASGIVNDPLYTSTPPNAGLSGGLLRRGFIIVKLAGGGPVVKGAPVFVSIVTATAGQVFGTSAAAGTGAIALDTKSSFMGAADSTGITELAFNL